MDVPFEDFIHELLTKGYEYYCIHIKTTTLSINPIKNRITYNKTGKSLKYRYLVQGKQKKLEKRCVQQNWTTLTNF